MSELQTLEQKVETIAEHLKEEAKSILIKAHAELDKLLGIEHKDAAKVESVVDAAVAEAKETEGEVSAEVKSL